MSSRHRARVVLYLDPIPSLGVAARSGLSPVALAGPRQNRETAHREKGRHEQ